MIPAIIVEQEVGRIRKTLLVELAAILFQKLKRWMLLIFFSVLNAVATIPMAVRPMRKYIRARLHLSRSQ